MLIRAFRYSTEAFRDQGANVSVILNSHERREWASGSILPYFHKKKTTSSHREGEFTMPSVILELEKRKILPTPVQAQTIQRKQNSPNKR